MEGNSKQFHNELQLKKTYIKIGNEADKQAKRSRLMKLNDQ